MSENRLYRVCFVDSILYGVATLLWVGGFCEIIFLFKQLYFTVETMNISRKQSGNVIPVKHGEGVGWFCSHLFHLKNM